MEQGVVTFDLRNLQFCSFIFTLSRSRQSIFVSGFFPLSFLSFFFQLFLLLFFSPCLLLLFSMEEEY